MTVTQSLKEGGSPRRQSRPAHPVAFMVLFIGGVVLLAILSAPPGLWQGPEQGHLVDTDGYMRYLRIEELAREGDWFDSTSERSNYPFGESQHWTRPVDVYVLALSGVLTPVAGQDSLYWAAVLNAPLLLLGVGFAMYAAFRRLPPSVRPLGMLMLLGLVPVTAYATPGRVDHHAAILLVLVVTLGVLLRRLEEPRPARTLAIWLALGLWISTEFLVPTALVAVTLAIAAAARADRALATYGAAVFGAMTALLLGFLAVERAADLAAVEYDKLSVVHVAITFVVAVIFLGLRWGMGRSLRRNSGLLVVLGAASLLVLVLLFPGLPGGPFVDVDPRVRELWLYTVSELKPLWSAGGWITGLILFGPIALGFLAGVWDMRRHAASRPWVAVVTGWLSVYSVLALLQVRWALFGQVLAVPLVLQAIHRWYERLEAHRLTALVRPLVIVTLIFGLQLVGIAGGAVSASPPGEAVDCRLASVLPTLRRVPTTTVLAGQDVGPEILYRTDHRVVATPYHRNEAGILFAHDVMSMAADDESAIRNRLAEREIGLVLICPNADSLLATEKSGTLYSSLIDGSPPTFVEEVALPPTTDYLLFAVED